MKRNLTFKSILITACLFSVFAFIFVNLKADTSLSRHFSEIKMVRTQVESEAGTSDRLQVPNVSVLGRLWEIGQRFLDRTN
jgi:hypothetical protein